MSNADLPPPPVPPDADLKDFPFTPICRARLFGSAFHARATDPEWRAGVTLWLKSQDQVPAGSLPDDDVDLCRLAELGRDMKAWRKVRDGALRGWFKCSDGRLYHHVVAEVVNEQWKSRQEAREAREKWRETKRRQRGAVPGETRVASPETRSNVHVDTTACPPPVQSESALKGQGEGQGQGYSDPSDRAAKPPNGSSDPVKALFDFGVAVLTDARVPERQARSEIGKWRKTLRDDGRLMALFVSARQNHAVEPLAYLEKAVATARAKRDFGGGYVPPGVGG